MKQPKRKPVCVMCRMTHEKLENVRVILRLLSQWKVIFIVVLTLLSLELRMPL